MDEKTGGLLGLLTRGANSKPYYIVGERPLDFNGGEALFSVAPAFVHHHFIRNDGSGNFGFTTTGEFSEPADRLHRYAPTQKYGAKTYDAGLLETARQHWHEQHDAIDELATDMGLWEEGMPNIHRNYNLLANNCQHYVQWLDSEYDRLLRGGYR